MTDRPRFKRRQDVSFLARWTYSYVNETIKRGAKFDLDARDWAPNNDDDEADRLSETLLRAWDQELSKHGPQKASLARVTLKVNLDLILATAFFFVLEEAVLLVSANFLSKLLVWFQSTDFSASDGFIYAAVLTACSCTVAITHHVSWWWTNRLGTQLRVAFITAIYKKCMRLSISHTSSSGYIVNLVANDVNRFEEAANFFLFIVIGPVLLLIVTYFMYLQIGNAAFIASAVTLLVIPVQGFVSKMFGVYRRACVEPRDSRLKYVSDMLNGIMMVKLYAWEKPLLENIEKLREHEILMMWKANILRAFNLAFYQFFSCFIELCAFGSYFLMGGVLTPSKVYTTVVLLQSLKWNMGFRFPTGLQFSIESMVSFRRIQQFFLLQEIGESAKEKEDISLLESSTLFSLKKASFCWPASPLAGENSEFLNQNGDTNETLDSMGKTILENVSLEIKEKKMTVVIGPVGSGKSSLLNGILREMECISGSIYQRKNLRIAYAGQTPWILSGTILENILFGSPLNRERLALVVQCCALVKDLETLEHGIDTLVGERGITLSGGQKARLALARACYSDADVILLDDPLSAVDAKVGRQLFDECINGFLKDKARVLVTHQLQYVKDSDSILLLEDGKIAACGSYETIMRAESSFAVVMKEFIESETKTSDTTITPSFESDSQSLIIEEFAGHNSSASNSAVKEEAAKGTISFHVYVDYLRSGSSWFSIGVLVLSLLGGQVLLVITDWWVGQWASQTSQEQRDPKWGWMFLGLGIITVAVIILRSLLFFNQCINSSMALSRKLVNCVFRAEMRFFVENPVGRIMNRISSDLNRVDENIPWTFFDCIVSVLTALSAVILAASVLPIILTVLPFIGYLFYRMRQLYVTSSRQVKRHEAITRSPVYATIPATLEGLSTVRAFGAQARFINKFVDLQNNNTCITILYLSIGRWLAMRLDFISAMFLAIVAFTTVTVRCRGFLPLSGANVGLILTYTLNLVGSLQWAFRQTAEVENLMTATERILEYTQIMPEPEPKEWIDPPTDWPDKGEMEFKNLSLKYPPSERNVLKDISVKIPAGSTVGIVGRTGAGKSSIVQALFRLVRPDGLIKIDGIDTSQISLSNLRSRIAIIPQDPFCFRGTLRFNLDPTGKYSDVQLWKALEAVQLSKSVEAQPGKLESFVSENGGNWSVGERQLLCLARAILKESKVFVMDEATSAIDLNTDTLIGKVLRDKGGVFHGATILTIAHRLNTIIDYEYIMVLDEGKLVEFGEPIDLLRKNLDLSDAYFARLVHGTGDDSKRGLIKMAENAAISRTTISKCI